MSFNIKTPFVISTHVKKFTSTTSLKNKSKAAAFGSINGSLYFHNGTAVVPFAGTAFVPTTTSYLVDGAIAVTSHTAVLTKVTAGAYTIAAPAADGVVIDLVSTTSAAHVITGTNLFWAGVTGGPFNKVTFTAFPSHGFRLIGHTGIWHVLASALGTGTVGD